LVADGTESEFQSDLIDVSGVDLDRLNDLPADVFATALRRILRESREDPTSYVGFLNDDPARNGWPGRDT
jgi:FXSXX-COOH protein